MDEAALHRAVRGRTVMRAQLRRMAEAAASTRMTIQVIPYQAGAHTALDSTFIPLESTPSLTAMVYVDGLVGPFYWNGNRTFSVTAKLWLNCMPCR